MAIYSCNLKSIGRTTHDAGTAGAHIRYISRPEAEPVIHAHRMPEDAREARTWLDGQEREMRKNARVIDKLRIALPRELTDAQRSALVERFMAGLTGERIPWFAAIHQRGKDALNPHVHIAIHDRDARTGQRVLRLSDNARDRAKAGLPGPKAVEWVRERWEKACNEALAQAGLAVRIDRRTLSAQGIDREPTIHEGPRAQHIDDHVRRPESQARINGCGRVIDYPGIDRGRTRREFNAHIIDINLDRLTRSGNTAKAMWALFEKEQSALDKALETRLCAESRERTAEARLTSLRYLARVAALRAESRLKARAAARSVAAQHEPRRLELRTRQHAERAQLKNRQSRLYIRIFAMLDFTGITRRRQEAARRALSLDHREERLALRNRLIAARSSAIAGVRTRYGGQITRESDRRVAHLAQLMEAHQQADHFADIDRQQRELEREHVRALTDSKINARLKAEREAETKGKSGKTSDSFRSALMKTAKQEKDRGPGKDKPDRGYER
ncbi:MAG: MobA/MobL family protein [Hyphomicrobium sp.]|uniref:MobA/MobL family protein n=1 Tax=Hyphomicrobium sp. TaxID=82 RepID=UPI003D0CAD2A